MMAGGFLVAWQFYIRRPDIPVELARQHGVLYRFLLNKWYFDEIYDVIFSFRNRRTDVIDKQYVRVDVSEVFPFLVSPLSSYVDR